MEIIGFFGSVFSQLGSLWSFVSQPLDLFKDLGLGNISILHLMGGGLVTFLTIVLGLHIWHLVKAIG